MDRMDLDPWGKRKHPDIYDSSPAPSPVHPAKRSKVAHPPHQAANVSETPVLDSDSSSNGLNGATSAEAQHTSTPAADNENPKDDAAESGNSNACEDATEPVIEYEDLSFDVEERIRAKDAARERERVRLADTRRKRSETMRSWIDGLGGEEEAEAGDEQGEEGPEIGDHVRGIGVERGGEGARPMKKRRKGEVENDEAERSQDKTDDKTEETSQDKADNMPQEKQQETPSPERSTDNGVGTAQTDGKHLSPERRLLKRRLDESESVENEDLGATTQEADASRKRKRLQRRRDARTDEM
jgi:hypothetical protein